MKGYKHYSEAEDQIIIDNYKSKGNKEIGLMLGRPADGIKHRMRKLNLRRSQSQIKKLAQSPNAGHYKKGNIPVNTNPNGNGAVSARKDKNGRIYLYIRIKKGVWIPYHKYIWEKKYGKLPEDHVIFFKDQNQYNCNIENLECISRKELLHRNYTCLPESVRKTKRAINKLTKAINKLKNNE